MNKMTADSFFLLDSHDVKQLGSLIASRLRDIERSSGKETARVLQVGIPSRKRVQKARLHTHSPACTFHDCEHWKYDRKE